MIKRDWDKVFCPRTKIIELRSNLGCRVAAQGCLDNSKDVETQPRDVEITQKM